MLFQKKGCLCVPPLQRIYLNINFRRFSMSNGSLDADAMVFVAQYSERLRTAAGCNALVDTMVAWLQQYTAWPPYFKFKGKTVRGSDLAVVARYYIYLARSEAALWELKACVATPVALEVPLELESRYKEVLAEALGCPWRKRAFQEMRSAPHADPPAFQEGITAEALLFNYGVSLARRNKVVEELKTEMGFPPLANYEDQVDERVSDVRASVRLFEQESSQRLAAFLFRMRFDSLQGKIEAFDFFSKD